MLEVRCIQDMLSLKKIYENLIFGAEKAINRDKTPVSSFKIHKFQSGRVKSDFIFYKTDLKTKHQEHMVQ